METKVSTPTREVIISYDRPTVIIGERINPTGKKKLQEALKTGDLSIVKKEALEQVAAGATILDCNVNAPGVDDVKLLPEAIKVIQDAVDVPICIDSPNAAALAAGLKVYKGKPLVNSISGEKARLERVLPLIKEYGAAVIGLAQDDEGIPKTTARRVAITYKIVEACEKMGVPREDIVIDVMTYAIGAEPKAAIDVLNALRQIRTELGLNMTMGASNISFGMPDRLILNNAWMAMVIEAGGTALIADAAKVLPAVLSADLVLGRDRFARRYLADHRKRAELAAQAAQQAK
ncbi:MAG: dihydropteroate synthase [Dehalococcoidales bacterium]|jgi:5-methyltetrahydrofolate--homocysteine methyltransferase